MSKRGGDMSKRGGDMSKRGGALKRYADVPYEARLLNVSKADLLEAAWEFASLANDGNGPDDAPATYRKLVETLNGARERSERSKVRAFVPGTGKRKTVDACAVLASADTDEGA